MRAYWWECPDGKANFGDDLNRVILEKLNLVYNHTKPKNYHDVQVCPDEAELTMAGSVLEHLPTNWGGTVCGAGKLHEHSRINLTQARVFALRGHLTKAGVKGVRHDVALGDPALLVPRWFRQPHAEYNLGVVPHWRDTELHRRFPYGRLIDPRQPAEQVIKEIAKCKSVITSSLHGAIIADAYGIPRQAELPPLELEVEGGDFKWRDYASIYNDHPHFGHMHRVDRAIVEKTQEELHEALQIATGIDLPAPEHRGNPQISILVPFRDNGEYRARVWRWIRRYYKSRGLNAEIIQGYDPGTPFSKAVAVNNAARLAKGNIFAIIDADTYLTAESLQHCADQIEHQRAVGRKTWFMPYNELYRLNEETSLDKLMTNPDGPSFDFIPTKDQVEVVGGHTPYTPSSPFKGHEFGAMAQVMSREAFYDVNGMDPRFRGWGSEDVSFLRSLDTLWGQHEVAPHRVLHFWHARIGTALTDRQWVGQTWGEANTRLAQRYAGAIGEPGYMRALAEEHPLDLPLYY